MIGNWNYPTSVKFGAGRVSEIAALCRGAGIAAPLVVTDSGLASNPMIARVLDLLRAGGLKAELFAEIKSNPVGANVEAGVAAYRAGQHDGVVAIGGGSALDVGKVIAFMSGQTRPLWDFEDVGDWWTRADPAGIAPVIAAPTTSGTGSEVGRAGVITDESNHTKKIIFHPKMMPVVTLCDPELTLGLPAHLTAATGMDALSHCLEAYCAPGFHPMADGIAIEGVRLVKEALPTATRNGADIEARAQMMAAAAMGATAFQKGLGGMHALAHPIGAVFDTHHGLTNAVLMPYVLRFNRSAIETRIDRLAAYLGIEDGFDGFLAWVLALRAELGIPHALSALKVDPAKADLIAAMAVEDPSAGGNPIKLDVAATRRIFDEAMAG
ncbi:iron-containing alcohol dehydrogenase [Phenylobacterium montanum]|uniref:Alcohol dehydrogenase 2 n=1 Tax=Phenylobacterium montanum TaxID=2823693 RepID=A0A975IUT9_9CAUL|nr:iron-containing alcohol dehydrogenase [Caulobacter sp. S6]QUD88307.1 iron-containing alcohol dehydrogenase [Caulobacter sp. S6]